MKYKKLAKEYLEEAKQLNLHINKIKLNHTKHVNIRDRNFYYRIKMLYKIYLELKHMGEYLEYKYGGKSDDN